MVERAFVIGLMTIFNKCSKFQNDPINILGDVKFGAGDGGGDLTSGLSN